MSKMAAKQYKMIVCVPCDRQMGLQRLLPHLRRCDCIDEIHLWVNTNNPNTLAYIESQAGGYVRLIRDTRSDRVSRFFAYCTDPDALYIKITNDIIWMENGAIDELVQYRLDHPEPLLVYPNIINHLACDVFHKQSGGFARLSESLLGTLAHSNPLNSRYAMQRHHDFILSVRGGTLDKYRFNPITLTDYSPCSTHVACFFGRDMVNVNQQLLTDDADHYLSCDLARKLNRPSVILGGKLFAHLAYKQQRSCLDIPKIFRWYERDTLLAKQETRPKIKVVQMIYGNLLEPGSWFEDVEKINRMYCDIHGYEYIVDRRKTNDSDRHWNSLKVDAIKDNLHDCDYLLSIEGDCWFVCHALSLEQFILPHFPESKNIYTTCSVWEEDQSGHPRRESPCVATILMRNNPRTAEIIDYWIHVMDSALDNIHHRCLDEMDFENRVYRAFSDDFHIDPNYARLQYVHGYLIQHFPTPFRAANPDYMKRLWESPVMQCNKLLLQAKQEGLFHSDDSSIDALR